MRRSTLQWRARLREPLLHFLVLGGLLFALHSALDKDRDAEPDGRSPAVRITAADTEWLKAMWARQWHRSPTDEELKGIVVDYVTEEVLSREARELGLDVDDTIVRRRLAQKMTFLIDDTIRTSEPPESELHELYVKRPDLVRTPARVSFAHVFFSREHGDDRAARASVALAALSDVSVEPADLGDRLLLGHVFVDQDEQSLTNLFGAAFARAVMSAEPARWSGPVESGYGLHLVKVTGVQPSRARAFAEVRDQLAQEWHRERQETSKAQFYDRLMRKYQIVADPAIRVLLGSFASHAEMRP
jgi:hypothetical protein